VAQVARNYNLNVSSLHRHKANCLKLRPRYLATNLIEHGDDRIADRVVIKPKP
jgi:hypothetical protein